jgi:HIRAN domain-containing protein
VVGESHRQSALQDLSNGRLERGEEVTFIAERMLEPDNPVDKNAIKVCIRAGAQVGYLSRDDATHYHVALQSLASSGKRGLCRARLIGGTEDKSSIGVILDLRPAHSLAQAIGGDAAF